MYCPNCGKKIPENTTFCGYCGEPVFDPEEFYEEPLREPPKEPKKRGFRKVYLVPIICGAVVVLALVAGLIFKDQIASIFNKDSAPTGTAEQPDNEIQGILSDTPDSDVETTPTEMTTAAAPEIQPLAVGDELLCGRYASETLYWKVLAVDGDKALVITENAIDAMPYSTGGNTWSESTLRQWLNGSFLSQAFTEEERGTIIPTTITTRSNPTYGTYSGADCTDSIFLLSGEEAAKYFGADSARKAVGTAHANANRLYISKTGYCRWWLRDAGQSTGLASVINGDGVIDYYGAYTSESRYGVRPAMWIRNPGN